MSEYIGASSPENGDFAIDNDVLAEFLSYSESQSAPNIYVNAEGILEIGPDMDSDMHNFTYFFDYI